MPAPVHAIDGHQGDGHDDGPRHQREAPEDEERDVPLDLDGKTCLHESEQRHHGDGEKYEITGVHQLCPGEQRSSHGRPALLGDQEQHHDHDEGRSGQPAPGGVDYSPEVPGGKQVGKPDGRQPGRKPGHRQDGGPDGSTRAGWRQDRARDGCLHLFSTRRRKMGRSWKSWAQCLRPVPGPTPDEPGRPPTNGRKSPLCCPSPGPPRCRRQTGRAGCPYR